ncbi:hypothetical protein [Sulfitobacter sp. W074]|uniref:hypothetical protein n=1 Tax=Sulfitobacter sp. W074 TaxID=2867026 RepID=UPI0021A2EFB8|nr:hypothetical protein [Sulfitobacter sp. W074]UWR38647.1 hypothetical protein K3762_06395 [Sulfitobacter sp. W074]
MIAPDSDIFGVLSYFLCTYDPQTRHDRAEAVRSESMKEVADDLHLLPLSSLSAYEEGGEVGLSAGKLGNFMIARYGSVSEGKAALDGFNGVRKAFLNM